MPQSRPDAGFTLIELLIAIGILAAIAMLALPYARNGHSDAGIRAFTMTLVSTLKAARAEAIRTASDVDFVIAPSSRTFAVDPMGKPQSIPSDLSLHIESRDFPALESNEARVTFFPDGTSTGGRIRFSSQGGGKRSVVVDWATGAARLERAHHATRQ